MTAIGDGRGIRSDKMCVWQSREQIARKSKNKQDKKSGENKLKYNKYTVNIIK